MILILCDTNSPLLEGGRCIRNSVEKTAADNKVKVKDNAESNDNYSLDEVGSFSSSGQTLG